MNGSYNTESHQYHTHTSTILALKISEEIAYGKDCITSHWPQGALNICIPMNSCDLNIKGHILPPGNRERRSVFVYMFLDSLQSVSCSEKAFAHFSGKPHDLFFLN